MLALLEQDHVTVKNKIEKKKRNILRGFLVTVLVFAVLNILQTLIYRAYLEENKTVKTFLLAIWLLL